MQLITLNEGLSLPIALLSILAVIGMIGSVILYMDDGGPEDHYPEI